MEKVYGKALKIELYWVVYTMCAVVDQYSSLLIFSFVIAFKLHRKASIIWWHMA